MRPPPRSVRAVPWTVAVLACAVLVGGCGPGGETSAEEKAAQALADCHARWHTVGGTVVGLDEDPNPSTLADRWNSVIATIEYYENTDTAKNCKTNVANQEKAISALRDFTDRLRPYDMAYQLNQAHAAIDLYLHDPLPAPVTGEDNRPVQPPTKVAVATAIQVLATHAAQANEELEPGWQQTQSVDLTDAAAVTRTMQDLDFLAQDSPHWRQCEAALQVVVAAIHAQEGVRTR